jgi:hypothetical protein
VTPNDIVPDAPTNESCRAVRSNLKKDKRGIKMPKMNGLCSEGMVLEDLQPKGRY